MFRKLDLWCSFACNWICVPKTEVGSYSVHLHDFSLCIIIRAILLYCYFRCWQFTSMSTLTLLPRLYSLCIAPNPTLLPSFSAPAYYGQQCECNNTQKHRRCLHTYYGMHARVGGGNVWQQQCPLLSRLDASTVMLQLRLQLVM